MAVGTIEDILRRGGKPLADKKRGSVEWYYREVRKLRKEKKPGKHEEKSRTGKGIKTGNNQDLPGQMIMYSYDPKYKDTLPYYDRYPVVIPLEVTGDHILGLNLHYLPPNIRLAFIRALQEYSTETRGVRKLQISYGIIKSAKGLGDYAPCLKKYLHSHIRSQVVNIDDREWEEAVLLPVARWVGASESQVWADSVSGKRPKRRKKRL